MQGASLASPINDQAALVDRLCQILIERGCCDIRTIERGRRVATETGQRADTVLMQLGLAAERDMAECYAALLGVTVTAPERYPEKPLFADRLSARFLRDVRALPVQLTGNDLALAVADPLDPYPSAAIAVATGCQIVLEVAIPIELDAVFERLYADQASISASVGESEPESAGPLEEDAERLRDLASEAPIIRLVNQMIFRGVETQASDIHIEPFEDRLRLRYRYDGVLHEAESLSVRLAPAVVSRIKIMARLDIAERRLPQDGRIKLAVRGQDIDFRVSTIPSLHGEGAVLRILDRSAVIFDYARLGLPEAVVTKLTAALDTPNGIVLVTGPTGSGKTTTLYTSLLALNSAARKIITVEDPIEYQLQGINQIQVKPQIGLNFATLLRSILRHDPDIIMVGEIRDLETAQIAVQAALTGHLVLSTVHTNSAAATITRLRDMGVEDYLLTAVLRGVLAQRLVRRLCPHCRRAGIAPSELVRRLRLDKNRPGEAITLWHPVGCNECRNTGYRGRQAIAEFLVLDAEVERLIFARAEHVEVERAAVAAGMATMFQAGIDAALTGTTTLEEVTRSIRAEA